MRNLVLTAPGGERVRPTFDPRQVGEDRLSSVQYLRFDVRGQVPVAVARWQLRLALLPPLESGSPSVPALMGASEAVLSSSIQEGFGLAFIEATAARSTTASAPVFIARGPNHSHGPRNV